jgi:uncharacterized protein
METVDLVFMAIGFAFTGLNLLAFLALRRRFRRAWPRRGGLITALVAAPYWLLLHPGIFLMFGGTSGLMAMRHQMPEWFAMASMAFQFAVWVYGGLLVIKGLPFWLHGGLRRMRRLFTRDGGTAAHKALVDEERRRLLTRAALVVPAAVVATTAGGLIASRQIPVVRRIRLPVAREATNLHGLKILQISDVHVGSYMDWPRLEAIVEAMNALKADIHVMTGDLLDNHINQLEDSQRFLRALRPRKGLYLAMGNHEYIAARTADTPQVFRGIREAGADVLLDESRKINVGGDHLWLLGIDYPAQRTLRRLHERTTAESIARALSDVKDDGAPRVMLSHHPRTFYDIREAPVDLTLSGHTHGGQIKLGRFGDVALTPILPVDFYHNGFYNHNGRKLYVNAGAGGWLPVRINCPPELTLIELTPA